MTEIHWNGEHMKRKKAKLRKSVEFQIIHIESNWLSVL